MTYLVPLFVIMTSLWDIIGLQKNKITIEELERWLSRLEHLFLQRIGIPFLAPVWWLITVFYSSVRASDTVF